MSDLDTPQAENTPNNAVQVTVQKIYLKNASVEIPHAPAIYTKAWEPTLDVQVSSNAVMLDQQNCEVTLTTTVTAKNADETAYLVEVQQAGIFGLIGLTDGNQMQAIMATFCPNVLFPYLRQIVSSLIQQADFPPFILQPINFEAVYQQHLTEQAKAVAEAGAQTKH